MGRRGLNRTVLLLRLRGPKRLSGDPPSSSSSSMSSRRGRCRRPVVCRRRPAMLEPRSSLDLEVRLDG
eukprot:9492804-Pyramimonas_sp.AAC.1